MKQLFFLVFFLTFFIILFLNNTYAAAAPGLQQGWQGGCDSLSSPPTIQEIGCVFVRIVNVFMGIAIGVGVLSFIIAGIRFYTAQGDPKGIAQAKLTLTFAILGFILAIGSYAAIVLIGKLIGIDITPGFIIPS